MKWFKQNKVQQNPRNGEKLSVSATDTPPSIMESKGETHHDGNEDMLNHAAAVPETGLARKESTISRESLSEYPTGLRLVIVVISLCFAVFLVALDQTIIATAMFDP